LARQHGGQVEVRREIARTDLQGAVKGLERSGVEHMGRLAGLIRLGRLGHGIGGDRLPQQQRKPQDDDAKFWKSI